MKPAAETTLFGRLPLEEALRLISESGLRDVEVGLSHFDACGADAAHVKEFADLLSGRGLRLAALFALPGFDPFGWTKNSLGLSSPDEPERVRAVDQMSHAIAVAASLGCELMLSEFSGNPEEKEASLSAFRRSMEQIIPRLVESDTTLCFEAHPGDFIEDSFEAVDLLASFALPQVRYNYCVPHTYVLGHTPEEIVRDGGEIISHVHFADTLAPWKIFFCPTYTPKVKPHLHLMPGSGDLDFAQVISSLRQVGYQGFLSLQPFSHMDQPATAIKESKSRLEAMLQATMTATA